MSSAIQAHNMWTHVIITTATWSRHVNISYYAVIEFKHGKVKDLVSIYMANILQSW
jgi:hypothetical protein